MTLRNMGSRTRRRMEPVKRISGGMLRFLSMKLTCDNQYLSRIGMIIIPQVRTPLFQSADEFP